MTAVWVLLAAGIVLIAAEVFLPGMVAGIIGAICLVISVTLFFGHKGAVPGFVYAAAVMVASIAVVGVTMKYFPKTRFGSKMVLDAHSRDGDELDWLATLKGKQGIAHTMLRPAGTAIIDNRRIDVVTEGTMIPKGSTIEVLVVEGNRVVVRQV